MGAVDQIKGLVAEHGDQLEQAIDKVAEVVDKGADKLKGLVQQARDTAPDKPADPTTPDEPIV
jgi:ABC-type transporter Mla subunit MlaD